MKKPGIRQRARLALCVFRGGLPPLRQNQTKASGSFPLVWPDYRAGQAQWKMSSFQNWVDEGFNLNALIYEAIMYKVRAKWLAPLRAVTGTLENPEPLDISHPLAQLVSRPNPEQSMADLEGLSVVYLNLSGNAYNLLVRPRGGGLPEAIYSLRPDQVFIIPDPKNEKQVLGYLYVPENTARENGTPILARDMMHVKLPNPNDPLSGLGYGMPPLPIGRSADVDNSVTHFLKIFFERGVMLPGLLKFDQPLDDPIIARVKERWGEMYGGYENWSDIGVLDQGGDYQRLGLTFDEMGFATLDERNETRILGPFGVPAALVGARVGLANATYSNVTGLRKVFWEDTFRPELGLFETEYQYYLRGDDGSFVMYDYSKVPALQVDIPALVDAAQSLWQMGVPANQALNIAGIQSTDIPGGDVGWLPLSVVPASVSVARSADDAPANAEADDRTEKFWNDRATQAKPKKERRGFSPEQKDKIWKAVDSIATSWEGRFSDATEAQTCKDERALLALITKEKSSALEQKQTINWANVQLDWDVYFSQFAGDEWRDEFMPLVRGVVADQGNQWIATAGMSFDTRNVPGEAWFQEYMLKFAQPIFTTTTDDLHLMVSQALAEGWSIPQMEKQLGLTFDRYLDSDFTLDGRGLSEEERKWFTERKPRYRREAIARTETLRASNAGSQQLFIDWGVEKKEWYSSQDKRTRDTHAATHGQVKPVNEPFEVGGEGNAVCRMMHPLDSGLCPLLGEIINCRCTELPVIELPSSTVEDEPGSLEEFTTNQAADKWAAANRSINPALSPDEDAALGWYKGDGFFDVNQDLRDAGYSEDDRVELIDSALAKTRLDSRIKVFRGADIEVFEDYDDLTDEIIKDDAFVSTSLSRRTAEQFSDGLILEIDVPAGSEALNMERWKTSGSSESEILLPRGSSFRVKSDTIDPDTDDRTMVLELIP